MAATKTGLSVGSTFADRFQVEQFIGAGPMGEVFRVTEGDKTFALKVFLPRVVPSYVSAAKIKGVYDEHAVPHPAIIRPLEVGEHGGLTYLVLPIVDGASLREHLDALADDGETVGPHDAGLIAARVADILAALSSTTVHGGLKPSNILIPGLIPGQPLPDDAVVRLTDMGTSHVLSFSKYASLQLSAGAPYYYLAPEFVSFGGKVDSRADQFAIGALLYEMLTGKTARKGFKPASQVNPDVTEEWDDLIGRLLSPKPDGRFASVTEVRPSLAEVVGELPEAIDVPVATGPEAQIKSTEEDWVADAFDDLLDNAIAKSEALGRGEAPPEKTESVRLDQEIEAEGADEELGDLFEESAESVAELEAPVAEGAVAADIEETIAEAAGELRAEVEAQHEAETVIEDEGIPEDLFAEAAEEPAPVEEEVPEEEIEAKPVEDEIPEEPLEEAIPEAPVEEEPVEEAIPEVPVEEPPVEEAIPEAPVEEEPVEEEPAEAPIEEEPVEAVGDEPTAEDAVTEGAFAEAGPRETPEEAPAEEQHSTFEDLMEDVEEAPDPPAQAEVLAEPGARDAAVAAPGAPKKGGFGIIVAALGGVVLVALVAVLVGYYQGWFGTVPPPTPVVVETPTPEPTAPTADVSQELAKLINKSNALIAQKLYTKPPENSAIDVIKEIEKLDPNHGYPAEARAKMIAELKMRVKQFISAGEYETAVAFAKEGLLISPGDPDFQAMLATAQKGMQEEGDAAKLAKLVQQLKWYMNNKNFVSPAGANAFAIAKKIEAIDKEHPEPKKARQEIVAVKINQGQSYLEAEQWDVAIDSANDGLMVEPKNAKLLEIKTKALAGKEEDLTETPEAAPPVAQKCLDGMRFVGGGSVRMGSSPTDPLRKAGEKPNTPTYVAPFCVDLYEYPNQPSQVPKTNITWQEARQVCASVDKRLCTESEWERSCKGPANRRFPYGNDFNPNVCATQTDTGQKRTVAAAGGWAGCRSGFGVYDMSGNVREWTSSAIAPGKSSYVLKGGGADSPDYGARCAIRLAASPGTKSYLVGFRCCRKPNE